MQNEIYRGPAGHEAILTTDSPASRYGAPALRVSGPGLDDVPDLGPADMLPACLSPTREPITAGQLVAWACGAAGAPTMIYGGWIADMEGDEADEFCAKFCRQWPEGPQVPVADLTD